MELKFVKYVCHPRKNYNFTDNLVCSEGTRDQGNVKGKCEISVEPRGTNKISELKKTL